jgi:hypothetical protein
MVGVLTVAIKAVLREDGTHIAVEVDLWGRLSREGEPEAESESGSREGRKPVHLEQINQSGVRRIE